MEQSTWKGQALDKKRERQNRGREKVERSGELKEKIKKQNRKQQSINV